jgi:aldehyde:ferredoxin oxidoreductase
MYGYSGKMLYVDLTKASFEEHELPEQMARDFIGGYGIGAKVLFDMMAPGTDALGPDNVLGFTTGPLTGTGALFSGRYTVVCKSPVTGGWNDANSGGYFGPELKKAGYDCVFIKGASPKPVYIWINDGEVAIKDASHLWGKTVEETEGALKAELGDADVQGAVIGPAGEKLSLLASIMNDGHRAAGRGGCGAVMGSKNLKALVVRGSQKVPVADDDKLKAVNKEIVNTMKNGPAAEMVQGFSAFGTTIMTAGALITGDSPVKNWDGVGIVDFGEEAVQPMEGPAMDPIYRAKKYACANCPMGCGAIYDVKDGKWPVGLTGRPEYETSAAFGCLMLNKDVQALIKCNHICNEYGLDTISAGGTITWAIECFQNGVLTQADTGGIELTWGNAEAIVQATQEMAEQNTPFGKLLAAGSAAAAQKIGKGTEYLVTVLGIEVPMHDPKIGPGLSRTYMIDPTPARHVKGGMGLPQLSSTDPAKYNPEGSGEPDLFGTVRQEITNTTGLCLFGTDFTGVENMAARLMQPVTGWPFDAEEEKKAGLRIFNMRHAFNLREGLKPNDAQIPPRCVGEPPQTQGPLEGVTVDYKALVQNFFEAIDWDSASGRPSRQSLEELGGMEDVIEALDL